METLPNALYRAEEVRELDRRAIEAAGIAGETLMARAGEAAFAMLAERWPEARRIVVCCGKGNNGGDGFVIARLARQEGYRVRVLSMAEPDELRGSAAWAAQELIAAGGTCLRFDADRLAELGRADVVVDALLGTGLQREVAGDFRTLVEAINGSGRPVLAVDIPSGLQSDTGAVLGAAVRAELTPTFIGLKQGLFTGEGPACAGTVRFSDLGAPEAIYDGVPAASERVDDGLTRALLPPRSRTAHKGHFGHALVVGGGPGMAGAARMAGEAAQRVGAGLVTVATTPGHAPLVNIRRPELMAAGVEGEADFEPLAARAGVIAAGPGLGRDDWGRRAFRQALAADRPLVLDADALNLLAETPERREGWVLTPHPGEAARLLGSDTASVQADRFAAADELVRRYGGVAVLKGAGTIVADAGRRAVITAGNPGMASGGMGDVLTGVIAGLLAQGLAPFDAARLGAHLHGRAGDRASEDGERGLLAGDLFAPLRELVNPAP